MATRTRSARPLDPADARDLEKKGPAKRKRAPTEKTTQKKTQTQKPTQKPTQKQKQTDAPALPDSVQEKDAEPPRPAQKQKKSGHRDDGFDAILEPFYYGKSLTDPIDTARDKWNLLPAFLKVKGLVKQHISSFNYFVEVELKKIVRANQTVLSDVEPQFYLHYKDIYIGYPNRKDDPQQNNPQYRSDVTPNECRLRDLTYAAPIYVDLVYSRGNQRIERRAVSVGRLPLMLRSSKCVLSDKSNHDMSRLKECPLDPGGYFIVSGTEKVILVQEQLSKNRVIVEADTKKAIYQASVTSSTHERKSKTYVVMKKDRIYLTHNVLNEDICISIIFKAMGIVSHQEMMLICTGSDAEFQDQFALNFEEADRLGVYTQHQALEYLGSKIKIMRKPIGFGGPKRSHAQEALEALASVIIPHVSAKDLNFRPKAMYIAYMTRRVLSAWWDETLVDDRDYVGNKRLELAGQMLSLLFEDLFKKFNYDIKMTIDKVLKKNKRDIFDALKVVEGAGGSITTGMNRAISTGNWQLKRFRMNKAGVTHVLSRLSYISALGMMTRITSQFEKSRKVSGPRALQPSQFGMLCTSDTPEGEACGLVKNLALMTHITTDDEEDPVKEVVYLLGAQDITAQNGADLFRSGSYAVFVNGTPIALTRDPKELLNNFRCLRRKGRISEFVSIFINHHHAAVHIATDEGRICRPVIIVEKGKSKVTSRHLKSLRKGTMSFDSFLRRGLVEYVDVNEENDSNIAMYEADINGSTTHLEIEPFTILGAVAGLIPYPHHNQSPRNTYQCAMGKQAIGAIATNQFLRIDTLLFLMVYPQKPMVKTRPIELIRYDKLPAGQNAIVAVMSFSGYDIEDAIVVNKASADRGFGRCQVYRKYATSLKKHSNGLEDRIGDTPVEYSPGGVLKLKNHGDTKLDRFGVVEVGEQLSHGDKYLLKQVPINTSTAVLTSNRDTNELFSSQYMSYRLPEPSIVDTVMISVNESDAITIKIKTRQTRRPEVGDKFSSRHGQKGVVGIIAEQVDMPFDKDGIVPDIIMNPHGFPSRMTVGKMLELLAGKAGTLSGDFQYGTAFQRNKVDDIGSILLKHGFSYEGKDFMTSGITGEPLPAYVFFGPIYYQKLKHMVQDKMHSRSRGPRAVLTRQPTEGRSRDGGLRLGEMERDCLIAYGASQLLLERLMHSSDAHQVDICNMCGQMGYQSYCQTCRTTKGSTRLTIPYAAKLLVQEMLSMNIAASFKMRDEFPDNL